jgi:hypothetical protein
MGRIHRSTAAAAGHRLRAGLAALLGACRAEGCGVRCFRCWLLSGRCRCGRCIGSAASRASGLLELASVLALALVWRTATRYAAWIYTAVVALSAASLIAGQVALHSWKTPIGRVHLLLAGFGSQAGHCAAAAVAACWLPKPVPALVIGVIIAVVDIAAFGELYLIAQAHPEFLRAARLLDRGRTRLLAAGFAC